MNSTEREAFNQNLRVLCAGKNVPLGEREEAYWRGLAKMSLVEFGRVVDFALGDENTNIKIPTTGECWQILRGLKNRQRAEAIRPPAPTAELYTQDQRFANQLLCDWLAWHFRRQGKGIDETVSRKLYAEARRLADDFEPLRRDNDPAATGMNFLDQFCDQVLTPLVSPEIARSFRAYRLSQERKTVEEVA